ncbi:hypothetical protein [Streptomyces sp. NPDC048481]|uniref:hypothetical protein n=1 Tax=Streptomyces sp. NPDC048481 TaxID=3365557 RepID=UPI00371F91BA
MKDRVQRPGAAPPLARITRSTGTSDSGWGGFAESSIRLSRSCSDRAAHEASTAADAYMERLDAGARADTWLTQGEQKHHVHPSDALTSLGDVRRARENRALELSAPTSSVSRSRLTVDAAAGVHHDGRTDETRCHAVAVLDGRPNAYRTGLVHRRALDLYRSTAANINAKAPYTS